MLRRVSLLRGTDILVTRSIRLVLCNIQTEPWSRSKPSKVDGVILGLHCFTLSVHDCCLLPRTGVGKASGMSVFSCMRSSFCLSAFWAFDISLTSSYKRITSFSVAVRSSCNTCIYLVFRACNFSVVSFGGFTFSSGVCLNPILTTAGVRHPSRRISLGVCLILNVRNSFAVLCEHVSIGKRMSVN